jgi:hypothetical protein
MVCRCRMGDFAQGERGHVARDAIVLGTLLEANIRRKFADALGVALQATFLVVGDALRGRWQIMRIVARGAPQLLLAPLVAPALPHLLDMTVRPDSVREIRSFRGDVKELLQGESGPIVE